MARSKTQILTNPRDYRKGLGENQSVFWSRFGVTQSGGSRFENDRSIPEPLALLILAWSSGAIDDTLLKTLRKAFAKAKKQ